MPWYRVNRPAKIKGEIIKDGNIELDAKQAEALLKSGALSDMEPTTAPAPKGKAKAAANAAATQGTSGEPGQ